MKFLVDLFPVILFFGAYKIYDIYIATAVAIAAAALQVGLSYLRHRQVEKMQLVTLGLLALFGGLTLALRDPTFIKWKPTVINWLFAAAIIGSGLLMERNLIQRMMDHALSLPEHIWKRLNLAWGGFFLGMGGLNLYVAYNYSEETWVDFKLFGLMGLTLLFVVGQGFYLARFIEEEPEQTDQK